MQGLAPCRKTYPMNKLLLPLKTAWPHALAVLLFIFISAVYFSPVLEGKGVRQGDDIHAKGAAQELYQFEEDNPGEESQWTGSMFSGMPAYHIKGGTSYNVYLWLQRAMRLGLPYTTMAISFIYLFGFYIFLVSLKIDWKLALVGALAFALGSYNFIIIEAGHITKTYAIAYMAPVIAGVILAYRKKLIAGALLTAVALGVQISTTHVQITYYLALMVGLLVLVYFIDAIVKKTLPEFTKATGFLVVAAILAVMPNISNLLTTYEYGKESTRSQTELTATEIPEIDNNTGKIKFEALANAKKEEGQSSGLSKSYALGWSYGIGETWSLFIPNVKGGGSGYLGNHPESVAKAKQENQQIIAQQNQYWGDQPFTSGPVYAGAIVFFLFIVGLFVVKGRVKWFLLAATVLGIFLAWGKNFGFFTNIVFDYLPMYNKFRTVSMALVITSFTMPALAIFAIKEFFDKPELFKTKRKQIYIATGSVVGIALLFLAIPQVFFSFLSLGEAAQFAQIVAQNADQAAQYTALFADLEMVRVSIFRADVLRSLLFVLAGAAVLFLYGIGKIKQIYVLIALGLLITVDMWTIDKRHLNNADFVKKSVMRNTFQTTLADEIILKDNDIHFRVFNLTRDPFNDGYTPYYHKSIGGYHGAKLRRYQELIDYHLDFRNKALTEGVLNMLNAKYVLIPNEQGEAVAEINMNSAGNVWFATDIKKVETANQAIATLYDVNPTKTVVIEENKIPEGYSLPTIVVPDSVKDTSLIKLIAYKPNKLSYQVNAKRDEFAVFSEVYYPYGWNAYLDGQKVAHLNVNYVLRGMAIPVGTHVLEFKFEPKTHTAGQAIAGVSSGIVVLLLIIAMFFGIKAKKEEEAAL